MVELQIGKKIKCLRTDNDNEYFCNEFDTFDKDCGIKRKNTTLYSPHQSGVVEIMNMTLIEKPRSMLSGARLKKKVLA